MGQISLARSAANEWMRKEGREDGWNVKGGKSEEKETHLIIACLVAPPNSVDEMNE